MRITTKSKYGMRMIVEIAAQPEGKAASLKAIARKINASEKYLEQIVIPLTKAGYLKSLRGANGGYVMGRSADCGPGGRSQPAGLCGRDRRLSPGGYLFGDRPVAEDQPGHCLGDRYCDHCGSGTGAPGKVCGTGSGGFPGSGTGRKTRLQRVIHQKSCPV